MAKEPIIAATSKTLQPNPGETRKDQKGYQLPEEYNAQMTNQEFDRVHSRINAIVQEDTSAGEPIANLAGAATLAEVITQVNLLAETLRKAGLLRRTI